MVKICLRVNPLAGFVWPNFQIGSLQCLPETVLESTDESPESPGGTPGHDEHFQQGKTALIAFFVCVMQVDERTVAPLGLCF